jgi:hypothetical protein
LYVVLYKNASGFGFESLSETREEAIKKADGVSRKLRNYETFVFDLSTATAEQVSISQKIEHVSSEQLFAAARTDEDSSDDDDDVDTRFVKRRRTPKQDW